VLSLRSEPEMVEVEQRYRRGQFRVLRRNFFRALALSQWHFIQVCMMLQCEHDGTWPDLLLAFKRPLPDAPPCSVNRYPHATGMLSSAVGVRN